MSLGSGDNRPYHARTEGSADDAVPWYAHRMLVVGEACGAVVAALALRPRAAVYAVTAQDVEYDEGLACADAVVAPDTAPIPFPHGFFDALILCCRNVQDLELGLARFDVLAGAAAALVVRIPMGDAGRAEELAGAAGWRTNHCWPGCDDAGIVRAFRCSLDLRAHARALFDGGGPALAYDLLYTIPYDCGAQEAAAFARDSLVYLSEMPVPVTWPARLSRFARAQWLFSHSCCTATDARSIHRAMAKIFAETGQDELSRRIFRSGPVSTDSCVSTPPRGPAVPPLEQPVSSVSAAPSRIRRVLLLTHEQMDYGLDTLFDGLCEILGDGEVITFPYKASLHTSVAGETAYYPAAFRRDGDRCSFDAIRAMLAAGAFDLVLYGDLSHNIPRPVLLDLLDSSGATPLAVLDQGDSPVDDFASLTDFLGGRDIVCYFKREMLMGVPYHPRIRPLPFSYPACLVPPARSSRRTTGVYWAGNRDVWMRQYYLGRLETVTGTSFDAIATQDDYRARLFDARIAPSFFGGGFDTVRYWEAPAHGSLLLAERPPIEIPANFRDGLEAIYFDDVDDFEEKLRWCLGHPEECDRIGQAGRAHLLRYHTNVIRARQLLYAVEAALAG